VNRTIATALAAASLAVSLAACAGSTGGTAADPAPGSASPSAADRPADGAALLRQMHARYDGKWYRTLTFVQEVYYANGRPTETWHEAGMIPGKLRIDHAPIDSGNMSLYAGDSAYSFRGGKLVNARKDRNLLMTLGFDVYGQDPAISAAQLREQGVDLSVLSEGTWQDRPIWIVGAAPGDSSVTQFWIEKDRLLFVRLLQWETNPNTGQKTLIDAEFNKYQPLGRGWIAPEVVLRINGKDFFREVYRDMAADPPLPADLFSTTEYRRPGWVSADVR
jgi:hypothetical protein